VLKSTPEYTSVHMADLAAQAPSRQVKEFLAQRRAAKRQKRRNLVASIPRAISKILPIRPVNRVELETTPLAAADGGTNREIRS
jgi:hypothetical protein